MQASFHATVRLAFLIAKLNDLEMVMTDIGNAYLYAACTESITPSQARNSGRWQAELSLSFESLYGSNPLELHGIIIWQRAHGYEI
jgi:hypothetical protein